MNPICRREFLGAITLPAASIALRAQTKEMTAAVIGHTDLGDYGHGLDLVFKNLPNVRVVAVADQNAAGREKAKQRIGAERAYADYRQMLAKEKPNLVSVAPRWTVEHFEMVNAALDANAHVFCEKPFTTTLRESDQLLALAAKKNLRIAVAHQMRMAPSVVGLRQKISDGLIGELVQMRAFGKQDARAGGEDMLVLGTHLFDLMRLFAGDARRCSATIWSKHELAKHSDRRKVTEGIGYVLGDEIEAQFEFDRAVTGSFTSRGKLREITARWRMELHGTKGAAMILADIEPKVLVLKAGGFDDIGRRDEWLPFEFQGDDEIGTPAANRRLAIDWLKAIHESHDPECSGAKAAKAVEMVMAVYESHLSGKRVELPLINRDHPLS
ncbi:MAG TPA: Gfo/Idh/MocA family oxidoreductase [Verrucomicrobiae bacterium]|nr:Gfo/Idh/MocA family oxidoreductase [Verrucomicrobiae bacterium]